MRPPREPCPPPMQFSGPHREAAHQEGGWVGASPGRTFRKSLFHTVSLMSAWCRPGLKEMGLNAPSKSRACWSSALGAVVHSEGGGLTVHPAPSSECRSNQPIRSSEARPILSSPPPLSESRLLPGRENTPHGELSRCRPGASSSTWGLVRNANFLGSHPRPDES